LRCPPLAQIKSLVEIVFALIPSSQITPSGLSLLGKA